VLTPRFSPSSLEITYMEFGKGRRASISTTSKPASARSSANFPNMSLLAAVLARRPARHHESAARRQLEPVRDGSALEVRCTQLTDTPMRSIRRRPMRPMAGEICFESDRGGNSQQIYVMNADGSRCGAAHFLRRADAIRRRYGRRDGDYIAFTKQGGGQFLHRHHEAGRQR
jgi:TolB protein